MKNIVKDMQAELYAVQPVDVPERQREGQQSWLPLETLPTSLLLGKKKSLILLGSNMCQISPLFRNANETHIQNLTGLNNSF